jgi:uncharacterized iron-regulated membrane protein
VEAPAGPAHAHALALDRVLEIARARHPDRVVQFVSQEEDAPGLWFVTMTPTPAPTDDFRQVTVDGRTGAVLPQARIDEGFLFIMLKLHVDLFAGLAGKLFLGFMGTLLLLAVVSGVVLYAPFMRKLPFGAVRHERASRTRWLDLHNLLGIVTLVWALVVGATGVINTGADLIVRHWQEEELAGILQPYRDLPLVREGDRASAQVAYEAALAHAPGMKLAFIAFPGTAFSSPHHLSFYLHGATPLTARLPRPVLVDARTARVTAAPELPWYLAGLLLSQPLHFGDYGGMPMKILWALLDLATLVVLGSGLYLWLKPRAARSRLASPAAGAREALP